VLRDRREPLVLAGVDYLLPLYRNLSRYGAIAAEQLTGNPEDKRDEELHREAWGLMESRLAEARRRAMARIQEALNTGQGSDRLTDVVPAAVQGRVDVLLAPLDRHIWGRFDPDTQRVEVHEEQRPGDEDLYELSAVQTFLHGGQVYHVQGDRPAARFRY
jgi:hypothetical protein